MGLNLHRFENRKVKANSALFDYPSRARLSIFLSRGPATIEQMTDFLLQTSGGNFTNRDNCRRTVEVVVDREIKTGIFGEDMGKIYLTGQPIITTRTNGFYLAASAIIFMLDYVLFERLGLILGILGFAGACLVFLPAIYEFMYVLKINGRRGRRQS